MGTSNQKTGRARERIDGRYWDWQSCTGDHMDAGDDQTGMRDHMNAGDAWRNLCKLKTLYENGWVPQKCGTYEITENRYHKYHNVV